MFKYKEMWLPKIYYQERANILSRVHITNNTDNLRVITKELWSLFSEFLTRNNSKTLGELAPNNSTHLFGVTNNVDNCRELLSNKRDFFRANINQYWHF